MTKQRGLFITVLVCLFCAASIIAASAAETAQRSVPKADKTSCDVAKGEVKDDVECDTDELADPLYYSNLAFFHFNDKLYYWALEPTARGYKYVAPEIVRVGVGNFFSNLRSPVNVVNNLLQLKPAKSGLELLRFVFNSVVGVGGFYDASYDLLDLDKKEADFGQTLGYYGLGQGIYLVWPVFGPSSLRETVGFVGDQMMSPATYIGYFYLDFWESGGIMAFDKVNDTSFKLGDYEMLVGSSVDPYGAMKDAFEQYRAKQIKKAKEH